MFKAKLAFEEAINAITPTIATVYENVSFTPTINVPYQELYDIPSSNDHLFINSANYEALGVFQITLRYPSGKGTKDVSNRAELYVSSFPVGTKLTSTRSQLAKNIAKSLNYGMVLPLRSLGNSPYL